MKGRKKVICGIAAMIMTLLCAILPAFSEGAEEIMTVEAETGELMGNTGVSGDGAIKWVEGFRTAGADSLSAEVTVTREGFYDIAVIQASLGGHKENQVLLDGVNIGTVITEETTFGKSVLEHIFLSAGSHTLGIGTGWGYIRVDRFELTPSAALPEDLYRIPEKMSVGEATPEARRLYDWLREGYGKRILSGQQCDGGMYGMENQAVWRATGGDYPAVLGLDMIDYSLSRVERGGESDRAVPYAIEYWNQGGIVTFCWHWNAPSPYLKEPWYSGFYTKYTTFDLGKVMNGEDEEGYRLLNKDIDAVAVQLLRLKEAGVPVLWRPLHEASGGWFWWGASGPDAYKQLYILLYDKLTNEYGLNNLIWVWNGQSADWYPGDEYVDIIGWDIYPGEHVYTAQTNTFLEAASISEDHKMIVLSENGCLFDPDLAFRDGATWGYFCTWCGEFVLKSDGHNVYGEKYTEKDILMKVYRDERVITRDDLPDLTTYPINK